MRTVWWSRLAIRDSADSGSPCEPVEMSRTRRDGSSSATLRSISSPSGTRSSPSSRAICMLRTIDRPTSATWRWAATAASSTCCTRCTCEAKQATMIAAARLGDHVADHDADILLGRDEAADLGIRGVGEQQVDAFVAEPGEAVEIGEPAVQRRLVHLEVAGVQDGLATDADRHRHRVRDGVVHREELEIPLTDRQPLTFDDAVQVRLVDAVLVELGRDEGERQPRAVHRDVAAVAQQVGQRADVVLVPVREHDRVDVVESIGEVRPVRQGHVDTGGVGLAEQHAAVDDEEPCRDARRWSCCDRSP